MNNRVVANNIGADVNGAPLGNNNSGIAVNVSDNEIGGTNEADGNLIAFNAQQGIILNVIVGIVGALLAGFVISPLLGIGTINQGVSVATFLVSLGGAVILLAIVNLFRRGSAR